jgi:hypothetical protein
MADDGSRAITLVFRSAEELQTSLVLRPRIEEEGIGAIVDSYLRPLADAQDGNDNTVSATPPPTDHTSVTTAVTTSIPPGSLLEAISIDDSNNHQRIDLNEMEFAAILAHLRTAPAPVRLHISYPPIPPHEEEEEETVATQSAAAATESTGQAGSVPEKEAVVAPRSDESSANQFQEEKKMDPLDEDAATMDTPSTESPPPPRLDESSSSFPETTSASSVPNSFLTWASRLSATSVQLATSKAAQAMEVASEQRKAAAAAMAKHSLSSPTSTPTLCKNNSKSEEESNRLGVDLFVQTSSGAFLPLAQETQRANSALRVTNSSLLTIRKSPLQDCSPHSYSFQWYRSIEASADGQDATEWITLSGATARTFQPTTTEVGHKIQCLVTQVDDTDEEEEDGDYEDSKGGVLSVSLQTFECVSAALPLFNGARKALSTVAQFGGLKGHGNATGRNFRIKVSVNASKDPLTNKSQSTSALYIYQVSGATLEPIHPEEAPIHCVAAHTDHESAKRFDLVFAEDGMPEESSMVRALMTDGRLQLSASNRLGRESLLLSIGIANYAGEPSNLGPSTVLYHDSPSDEKSLTTTDEFQDTRPTLRSEDKVDPPDSTEPLERPPLAPNKAECIQGSTSLDGSQHSSGDDSRVKDLERELSALRSKLGKKSKLVEDLQRQASSSKSENLKIQSDLSKKDDVLKETRKNLLVTERRMQSQADDMKRMRSDHSKVIKGINEESERRSAAISELEKANRILQNEKAVLSATVGARDGKLTKMAELQASLEETKADLTKAEGWRNQLNTGAQRYDNLFEEFQALQKAAEGTQDELESAHIQLKLVEEKMVTESKKADSCRVELGTQQMKIQKLKAERNSYKQKSDSLSKEISRVCRQGRTIKDVERIIADDASRRQEVALLREQKRKALEDLNHYRTSFEQSRAAQRLAGLDHETAKVLERNAELERLLAEITEYVSAKEMQLETMKQINDSLQSEIGELHRVQRIKNLGKNDV